MTENMRYLLIFRGFETPTACRLVTRLDENERRCITAFPSPKHLVYYGIEIGIVVLALTVQEQAMPLAMRRWVIDDKYQTRRRATQTTHWQDSHKSGIKRHRFKYAETRKLDTLNLGCLLLVSSTSGHTRSSSEHVQETPPMQLYGMVHL
jgi:hypothetical protein